MQKPKILIFTSYYLPGYKAGGPIRSVSNIIQNLGEDFDFYVVTKDRDSFEDKPYDSILVDQWNTIGDYKVFYASAAYLNFKGIKELITTNDYDCIYLNSFLSVKFSLYPVIANKRLRNRASITLAPRGEFSKGALEQGSIKKKLFIWTSRIFKIHNNVKWHASTTYEEKDIENAMGNSARKIVVAPNIPAIGNGITQDSNAHDYKNFNLVFLSRISRKKNLDFALNVLKEVKFSVDFDIYGLIDDQPYWSQCLKIIEELPDNIKVHYHGVISHKEVTDKVAQSDLFFLPTKGENYGHAIVESLLSGTPVLLSDQTPWRDLEKAGVGWDISLKDPNLFLKALNDYHIELSENRQMSRKHIYEWITEKIDLKNIILKNKNIFISQSS